MNIVRNITLCNSSCNYEADENEDVESLHIITENDYEQAVLIKEYHDNNHGHHQTTTTTRNYMMEESVSSLDEQLLSFDPLLAEKNMIKKLHGRTREEQMLVDAYNRVTMMKEEDDDDDDDDDDELVLISGVSGTGKTSLANILKHRVEIDNGFYLSGKFERHNYNHPYQAFVTAFTEYTTTTTTDASRNTSDAAADDAAKSLDNEKIISVINKAVDDSVSSYTEKRMLVNMIPSLESIIFGGDTSHSSNVNCDDDDDNDDNRNDDSNAADIENNSSSDNNLTSTHLREFNLSTSSDLLTSEEGNNNNRRPSLSSSLSSFNRKSRRVSISSETSPQQERRCSSFSSIEDVLCLDQPVDSFSSHNINNSRKTKKHGSVSSAATTASTTMSGGKLQERLREIFCKFIYSICSQEHPVVFFVDDMHWADSSSLKLIKTLLNFNKKQKTNNNNSKDSSNSSKSRTTKANQRNKKPLLMVGAYRDYDNEYYNNNSNTSTSTSQDVEDKQKDAAAQAPPRESSSSPPSAQLLSSTSLLTHGNRRVSYVFDEQDKEEKEKCLSIFFKALHEFEQECSCKTSISSNSNNKNNNNNNVTNSSIGTVGKKNDCDSNHVRITHIKLSNLSLQTVNELITDILDHRPYRKEIELLSKVIYEQTQGNPFYIFQFLRGLLDQNLLYLVDTSDTNDNDKDQQYKWVWNNKLVRRHRGSMGTTSMDIVRFRIQAALCNTPTAIEVLKAAACIGYEIDDSALGLVFDDHQKVIQCLQLCHREGLLSFYTQCGGWRFSHDKIKNAAYSLIPIDERNAFKLKIGRKLWTMSSRSAFDTNLFVIVNMLNEGRELVDYKPERYRIAELNLTAAEKACGLCAFEDSSHYLRNGIQWISPTASSWKERYSLTLELYEASAEVAASMGEFDTIEPLLAEVFAFAKTTHDKMRSYLILINGLGIQYDLKRAQQVGLDVLSLFNERFPRNPSKFHVCMDFRRTKNLLKRHLRQYEQDLIKLKPMTNEDKMACMQLLAIVFQYAFSSSSPIVPLIVFRIIQLCLKYGLYETSAAGFAMYGMILCSSGKVIDGFRFGQMALMLVEGKFNGKAGNVSDTNHQQVNKTWQPRVCTYVYIGINHWTNHLRQSLKPLSSAARSAMETGDKHFSVVNGTVHCMHSYFAGISLLTIEHECNNVYEECRKYKQENFLLLTRVLCQCVMNLTGRATADPFILSGDMMDIDTLVKEASDTNNTRTVGLIYYFAMELAYLFGNYELASEQAAKKRKTFCKTSYSLFVRANALWIEGLTSLALLLSRVTSLKRKHKKTVRQNLKKIKDWSKTAPQNFLHKQKLLEAEKASLEGKNNRALTLYDQSIEKALKQGYVQDGALACERAACHLQRIIDDNGSKEYFTRAHDLYLQWGATAKASTLKNSIKERQYTRRTLSMNSTLTNSNEISLPPSIIKRKDSQSLSTQSMQQHSALFAEPA